MGDCLVSSRWIAFYSSANNKMDLLHNKKEIVMAQYIDKSALVVEIKRRIADNKKDIERASHKNLEDYFEGYEDALALLKQQFIDTLEVKEVDLEKEIDKVWDTDYEDFGISVDDFYRVAKHFFELGLKVAQKGE